MRDATECDSANVSLMIRSFESRLRLFAVALAVAVAGAAFGVPRECAAQLSVGTNPDSALALEIERIEGEPIALADAQAAARENATTVGEAAALLQAASGEARRERGLFDPELFADVVKRDDETPSSTPFSGAAVLETEGVNANGGARMRLPIGTELEASIISTRLESNSAFSALNPEYSATGALYVRQPLLKGFGPAAWDQLERANRALEAAEASHDDAMLAVRSEVETTYWALYAAERDLGVQRLVVDRARAFLTEAKLRTDIGLVGPSQVANARVFLAEQELTLIDIEEALDLISDRLGTLMGRRPAPGQPRFRPSDEPPTEFAIEPQDSLVARALRSNREVRAAERIAAAARAEAQGAAWDALPAVDLVGSVGGHGLSGTPRDIIFLGDTLRTTLDKGDFSDAWSQAVEGDFPAWSVGVNVTLPIFLREGRGERDRLRGELEFAEQQLIAAQRNVEDRVRANHRELANGARRLGIAREGVAASLEEIRIALIEYQNGQTTAFEVVRVGADLPRAQQRYSAALVRTARAAAELSRLTSGALAPSESTD